MSAIDLNMPGGVYPYPKIQKDEEYMNNLAAMTKEFENAGQIMNGEMPAQPAAPAAPVPQAAPQPAPQAAPAQATVAPAPAQELGQPIPAVQPAEPPKAKSKKAAKPTVPAPTPVEPSVELPSVLDTLKTNFATDLENIKSDWDDLLKLATAKPAESPEDVEKLKAEIDSMKVQMAELEKKNADLEVKLEKARKAMNSFLEP